MSVPEPGGTVYNERTALAWQRTALALLACAAIESRLALERIGVVAAVSVLVALPVVAWVMWASRQRYRSHGQVGSGRGRGGRAPAALAAVTALIGLTELAALLAAG